MLNRQLCAVPLPQPVMFNQGSVIADWKLFLIPRKTTWNTVGFAIFDGLKKSHTRIQKKNCQMKFNDNLVPIVCHLPALLERERGETGWSRDSLLSRSGRDRKGGKMTDPGNEVCLMITGLYWNTERRNAGTPEYWNPEHKITKTRNVWKINN